MDVINLVKEKLQLLKSQKFFESLVSYFKVETFTKDGKPNFINSESYHNPTLICEKENMVSQAIPDDLNDSAYLDSFLRNYFNYFEKLIIFDIYFLENYTQDHLLFNQETMSTIIEKLIEINFVPNKKNLNLVNSFFRYFSIIYFGFALPQAEDLIKLLYTRHGIDGQYFLDNQNFNILHLTDTNLLKNASQNKKNKAHVQEQTKFFTYINDLTEKKIPKLNFFIKLFDQLIVLIPTLDLFQINKFTNRNPDFDIIKNIYTFYSKVIIQPMHSIINHYFISESLITSKESNIIYQTLKDFLDVSILFYSEIEKLITNNQTRINEKSNINGKDFLRLLVKNLPYYDAKVKLSTNKLKTLKKIASDLEKIKYFEIKVIFKLYCSVYETIVFKPNLSKSVCSEDCNNNEENVCNNPSHASLHYTFRHTPRWTNHQYQSQYTELKMLDSVIRGYVEAFQSEQTFSFIKTLSKTNGDSLGFRTLLVEYIMHSLCQNLTYYNCQVFENPTGNSEELYLHFPYYKIYTPKFFYDEFQVIRSIKIKNMQMLSILNSLLTLDSKNIQDTLTKTFRVTENSVEKKSFENFIISIIKVNVLPCLIYEMTNFYSFKSREAREHRFNLNLGIYHNLNKNQNKNNIPFQSQSRSDSLKNDDFNFNSIFSNNSTIETFDSVFYNTLIGDKDKSAKKNMLSNNQIIFSSASNSFFVMIDFLNFLTGLTQVHIDSVAIHSLIFGLKVSSFEESCTIQVKKSSNISKNLNRTLSSELYQKEIKNLNRFSITNTNLVDSLSILQSETQKITSNTNNIKTSLTPAFKNFGKQYQDRDNINETSSYYKMPIDLMELTGLNHGEIKELNDRKFSIPNIIIMSMNFIVNNLAMINFDNEETPSEKEDDIVKFYLTSNHDSLVFIYNSLFKLLLKMIQGMNSSNFLNNHMASPWYHFYQRIPNMNLQTFPKENSDIYIFLQFAEDVKEILIQEEIHHNMNDKAIALLKEKYFKILKPIKVSIFVILNNLLLQSNDSDDSLVHLCMTLFSVEELLNICSNLLSEYANLDEVCKNISKFNLTEMLDNYVLDLNPGEDFQLAAQIYLFITILAEKYKFIKATAMKGNAWKTLSAKNEASMNKLIITCRFFECIVKSCEFVFQNQELKRVFFIIDPRTYLISDSTIDKFLEEVDRTSPGTKLKALIESLQHLTEDVTFKIQNFLKVNNNALKRKRKMKMKMNNYKAQTQSVTGTENSRGSDYAKNNKIVELQDEEFILPTFSNICSSHPIRPLKDLFSTQGIELLHIDFKRVDFYSFLISLKIILTLFATLRWEDISSSNNNTLKPLNALNTLNALNALNVNSTYNNTNDIYSHNGDNFFWQHAHGFYIVFLLASIQLILNLIYVIVFFKAKYFYAIYTEKIKNSSFYNFRDDFSNSENNYFLNKIKRALKLFYLYIFPSFLFNDDIFFMLINILIAGLTFFSYKFTFLFTLQLFGVVRFVVTVNQIFRAFKLRFRQFISMLCFLAILINFYSSFGFFFLRDEFNLRLEEGIEENFCSSLFACFITYLNFGTRSGGGIGDLLGPKAFIDEKYWLRYVSDMVFYVTVMLLLLNMINGIIISTFSALRDENEKKNEDISNLCFLCNIHRVDFEKKKVDFKSHTKNEHNVVNYLRYLVGLMLKEHLNSEDEMYIMQMVKDKKISFLPIGQASSVGKIGVSEVQFEDD